MNLTRSHCFVLFHHPIVEVIPVFRRGIDINPSCNRAQNPMISLIEHGRT